MGMVVRIIRVFRVSRLACEFRAGVVPAPVECANSLHIHVRTLKLVDVAQPLLAVQKGNQGRKQHSQEWLCHIDPGQPNSRATSGGNLALPNFPNRQRDAGNKIGIR